MLDVAKEEGLAHRQGGCQIVPRRQVAGHIERMQAGVDVGLAHGGAVMPQQLGQPGQLVVVEVQAQAVGDDGPKAPGLSHRG
ncbi:MAG: hypothetical protein QM742_05300 [Aquabacterium sp.]